MLERMQTLESLHTYGIFWPKFYIKQNVNVVLIFLAANFSKLFAELEESQATITKSVSGNKELLQNVQKAFADNHENVSQEVTKLEQRMSQLAKKWILIIACNHTAVYSRQATITLITYIKLAICNF